MTASSTYRYDAGNAGDLLKHGLIAEFARWQCGLPGSGATLTFLDPFGGLPVHCAKQSVVERVEKLSGFALHDAQPHIAQCCYYGSSHLLRLAAENAGKQARVFASDGDEKSRRALANLGVDILSRPQFNSLDGYSVLDCVHADEVILIDPFSRFLPHESPAIIPKIARVSAEKNATIVLCVLNLNPDNPAGKNYRHLKQSHLAHAWVLSCPPIPKALTKVMGESTYHVDVLLVSPRLKNTNAKKLHARLRDYANALSGILSVEVRLQPPDFSPSSSSRMKKPSAGDCDADPTAISAARARQLIAEAISPVTQIECVAVRAALGRVLARDVESAAQVPNHTNSAMDGYAFKGRDLPAQGSKKLRVVGVAMAGTPFAGAVGAGQCARIMTGAALPAGADSVVAQERVERHGDAITVQAGEQPGANVRQAGEDLEIGDTAIAAGQRLDASRLGLATSLGLAELPVFRRPRVAFFSNGNELRAVGSTLARGELYDSNRCTLYGMLAELGVEIVDTGIIADDAGALGAALEQAAACADMVITSAGASVGEADYVKEALARLGEVIFWKVAIKPGRPMAFGRLRGGSDNARASLFFGLPGNPVSVMVTFRIFVKAALRRLAGETVVAPLRLTVKTASSLKKRPGRTEYQRGVLFAEADGATAVRSTGEQGSGILRSMSEANCFIILPTDSTGVAAGERVEVEPFSRLY